MTNNDQSIHDPGAQSADRLRTLTSWHADWAGLRVAVLGLSVTGFSVADTLAELGASVTVYSAALDDEYARILPVIGVHPVVDDMRQVPAALLDLQPDLIVASPGFAPDHPVIIWAQGQGISVWGDVELAWRLRDKVLRADGAPADWVFITGTNGKTTTTQLTAQMLASGGLRPAPCGNIGVPILDAIRDPAGFDVLVVELSSHQLWYLQNSAIEGQPVPWSAACLNLADDHLVWHGSFSAYRDAKAVVYRNTVHSCVYNVADAATMQMVEEADVVEGARAIGFGLGIPGRSQLGVVEGILVDRAYVADRANNAAEITTLTQLQTQGLGAPHIVENILAASALSLSLGVTPADIAQTLNEFRLDAHRISLVGVYAGVSWIDDSKATNPHAAASSLRAFPGAIWLVGGDLKGVDLTDLITDLGSRVKAAIVLGVDRQEVVEAFRRHAPEISVIEVVPKETEEVMVRAVGLARSLAQPGDTVVLAPAAASFDQFDSYADRGNKFARAVRQLHQQTD